MEPPPRLASIRARLQAFAGRIIRLQIERPLSLLAFALATALIAGFLALKLEIKTSMAELLPEDKRSVVVANKVNDRLSAASVLIIVAQGDDPKKLEGFVDALSPELRALPPDLVGSVDDGVRASRAFFEERAALYAPLSDVRELHDTILQRYDWEVTRAAGLDVDDGDAPPPISAEALKAKAQARSAEIDRRYPDGYYLEHDGKLIAVVVHTAVQSGDLDRSRDLVARVQAAIQRADPRRFDPAMRVDLAGDFIESLEENQQVKTDLGEVGAAGLALILGVVFCFYLRFRTLGAMALTVGVGVLWTFGLTRLTIGHLNASTGFLVSVVAGNGINFGILYMARYLSARRTSSVEQSVRLAHRDTWASTLAAAGSAMVAYGSLTATDCRAFRQFGEIGGSGMMLCWIATYLFLPAMLVASERVFPVRSTGGFADRLRGAYARPFAFLALRFPRAIVLGSIAFSLGSIALGARYLASDPMEYDLSRVRTEMTESRARQLEPRAAAVLGRGSMDGVAILVDRAPDAIALKAALAEKRDAAPADQKPFGEVVTLFDFVPQDQPEKIALLGEIRDRLDRAHRKGLIAPADYDAVAPLLREDRLAPVGLDDLPDQVARPFTERDGTRGRVAYVTPAPGRTLGDARYLIEWAKSFRETRLPDGRVVEGSGRSTIFADLILAVIEDAPRTVAISLGLTALIVVLAFRGRRAAWIALGTLLSGLSFLLGFMALYGARVEPGAHGLLHLTLVGMKLNFLNFVALPISIGVGADYAVNMVQRRKLAGEAAIRRAVIETGGAVVLCSLTTTLGYLALTLSQNQAIKSFGLAAAAGEIGCVLAAVLVLPAWMVWSLRRRAVSFTVDDLPPSSVPA
jgi:uncharacterized protein